MAATQNTGKSLSAFGLLMIAIVTVDSIRNLSINAQFGLPVLSFYLFAGLTFFLPVGILTTKLAMRYPNTGGSYLWVRGAFGTRWSFVSIWLQWVYNMLWYPTIFPFIATAIAGMFFPQLETNAHYILITSLVLFWIITIISCFGIRAVSGVAIFCAILGTLFPMFLIIGLAAYWLLTGHASATPLSWGHLVPNHESMVNIAFFVNVLFSLIGLDVVGIHAGDVKNPKKTYPWIVGIAAVLVLVTMALSSLALAIVVPPAKIGLLNGLIDVAQVFFAAYHISWGVPLIGAAIILGSFGIASSWIIGLARTLHVASSDANMPRFLQKKNKHDMPYNILITQAVIVTILLSAYLLLPSVNATYWILAAMSSQLGLVYYVLLFVAAFKLLRSEVALPILLLFVLGVLTAGIGIYVGFLPPAHLSGLGDIAHYEGVMLAVIAVFMLPLIWFLRKRTA